MYAAASRAPGFHARVFRLRSTEFDRLFLGVQFSECDGDILFCFARDDETADEMENEYGLHIFIIATDILNRDIGIVMILPKVLHQGR